MTNGYFIFYVIFFFFGLFMVGILAGLNAYAIAVKASFKIRNNAKEEYNRLANYQRWSVDRGYVKAEDLSGWWRLYKLLYYNKKVFDEIGYLKHREYVICVRLLFLVPISFISIVILMGYVILFLVIHGN